MPSALWNKPIAEIDAPELLDFVVGLQATIPETASRVRQRLESILDDCVFRMLCAGNPAAVIRRKMREAHRGRERGQFAALDYSKAPELLQALRKVERVSARCLEFAILTAARAGDASAAEWREFDLDGGIWIVPVARMKGREKHTVYLSPRAVEIVKAQAGLHDRYVFPST